MLVVPAVPMGMGHLLLPQLPEALKHNHYSNVCPRPGQVSFNERSHELATLAAERYGCLFRCLLVDELAAIVVGGAGGAESLSRKSVCFVRTAFAR